MYLPLHLLTSRDLLALLPSTHLKYGFTFLQRLHFVQTL